MQLLYHTNNGAILSDMNDSDLASDFMTLIPRAMWSIRKEMRQIASSQFTVSQFRVLAHLYNGVTSNNDLAELQGVEVSTMSRKVNTLVNRGLVRRSQNSADRRQVHLKLTAKGLKEYQAIRGRAGSVFATLIGEMTTEEQQTFRNGLRVLKKILGKRIIAQRERSTSNTAGTRGGKAKRE